MPHVIMILFICSLTLTGYVSPAAAESEVGRIIYTKGQAWVQRGDMRLEAKTGALMYKDDLIVTGERGRMKLRMQDESNVYVGANSRLSLKKYAMKNGNLIEGAFDMFWGKARFFVNKLNEKRSSFSVRTSTAVLGVRGTEFLVLVPPTPELLGRAFEPMDYTSLPSLPTRMVLVQGVVEVGTKQGFSQRITAGNTADVDVSGKATVRQTKESDADQQPLLKDAGIKGNDSEQGDVEPEPLPKLLPPPPPKVSEEKPQPAAPPVAEPEKTTITNTIQNLGTRTDVKIRPSFVQP